MILVLLIVLYMLTGLGIYVWFDVEHDEDSSWLNEAFIAAVLVLLWPACSLYMLARIGGLIVNDWRSRRSQTWRIR